MQLVGFAGVDTLSNTPLLCLIVRQDFGANLKYRHRDASSLASPLLDLEWMHDTDSKETNFHDGSSEIIGACIEVHRHLGPGLLESAYERCLAHELALRNLPFGRQLHLPIRYKGVRLDCGYRIDFVVADKILVEIKAVERLQPIHMAQVLTYLKLTGLETGLLVNFNVPVLKQGLRRLTKELDLSNFPPSCETKYTGQLPRSRP